MTDDDRQPFPSEWTDIANRPSPYDDYTASVELAGVVGRMRRLKQRAPLFTRLLAVLTVAFVGLVVAVVVDRHDSAAGSRSSGSLLTGALYWSIGSVALGIPDVSIPADRHVCAGTNGSGRMGDVTVQARQVDPRDVNVEVKPTFRVYFWRDAPSLACREFEVTGGDVDDVIGWADNNVGPDETYELGVLTRVPDMQAGDVVLSRIKSSDPTRTDGEDGTPATAHG